jgi:protein CpxP
MKRLGFLLMVLVLLSNVACGQRGGQNFDPEERAKSQTEQLKKVLDLDKDQEKEVYELNLKAGKEMAEMRKEMQGGGDREAMCEKFGAMREKNNKEMKKVLSDNQYKKYLKFQEEQMQKRRQGRDR